jgi:heme/copper-type cytochrome/quinol oxidase subunit 1
MAAKNPARLYVPHHLIITPLSAIALFYSIRRYAAVAGDDSEISRLWFTVMVLAFVVALGLVLMRIHYAVRLQDRLIRLEVRQRYFELTGQRFAAVENQLTIKQIISLRLAGDAELPALAQAAATEKLSPKDIQSRINDFQFDPMRV